MSDFNDFKSRDIGKDANQGGDLKLEKLVRLAAEMVGSTQEKAEQGDAEAQTELGDYYSDGLFLPKNLEKAVFWYRKAADQNHARAQLKLAALYYTGEGLEQDYGQAASWARKAANRGDSAAQWLLGHLFEFGQGVGQNDGRAAYWYQMAADQENPNGQDCLGSLYMRGAGVPQDTKKGAELFRLAAQQGDATAMRHFALSLENGVGVKKDLVKAIEWYEKAVKEGDEEAPEFLDRARKALKEQQAAEERQKREAAEKAERDRISAMWEARDTSMETWAIVAAVLTVAALIGEKWLMIHKGPFLLVLVEMAAVALSVIGATVTAALFAGSFTEVLSIPGGIAGFVAGLVAVILNGSSDRYPHVNKYAMIAAAVITVIMIIRIIIKKQRPKP